MRPLSGPADRPCFIHVGTHKSGTTAIQRFLAANAESVAAAGLYYPRAGRMSADFPGHHNVAFELNEDARFDPAAGTLAGVIAEIARARPLRACLSSEDFEYLHVRRHALIALRDAILAIGYRPRIVLYVRAQADYAESLYAELVKHGMTLPFASFLGEVERYGVMRYEHGWTFRFAYSELVERLASVFGRDAVIVRGYRDDGPRSALIRDFLDTVGMAAVPCHGGDELGETANPRLNTGAVIESLYANTSACLGDDRLIEIGADIAARRPDVLTTPFRPLARADRDRIAARFADDNALLIRRWNVAPGTFAQSRRDADLGQARMAGRIFEQAEAIRSDHLAHGTSVRRAAGG